MTAPFDTAPDAADRPPVPGRALVPYRPRPSRMGRVFRWWLGLSAVVLFAGAFCVMLGLHNADFAPVHIVIGGDAFGDGPGDSITITGLDDGGQALLAVGGLLLAVLVLLLLPLLILLIVGSVAIALVFGIGVPLIVLALALGVVTSPLWLIGLLVWMIARRRSPAVPRSATMPA
jgi:hypothetical protein